MGLERLILGAVSLIGFGLPSDLYDRNVKVRNVPEVYETGIEHFRHTGNVLILCHDKNEFISVRDTIGEGFNFDLKNGYGNGKIGSADVDVRVLGMGDITEKYDDITLRGHFHHMKALFDEARLHEAEHTTYIFGGCWSGLLAGIVEEENRAFIGLTGKGNSAMNSYLLRQTLDELKTANSWDELRRNIESKSQIAREEVYFPGERHIEFKDLTENTRINEPAYWDNTFTGRWCSEVYTKEMCSQ